MRFVVASLSVLGNAINGWEVNDEHQVGTIDVSREVIEDDQLVLNVLNASEFLTGVTINDVYFMGEDNDYLVIHDEETERPLLALIREH